MAAENIDNTVNGTGLFPAKVPGLSDAADIQAALRLYHYGSYTYDGANTNTTNLVNPSIAKHLQNLVDADAAEVTNRNSAITTHNTATTSVHGIANTADLATKTYVNTAVSSAVGGVVGEFSNLAGTAIDWNSVDERFDVEPRLANSGTVITKTESFILSPGDVGKTAILYSSNPMTVTLPANDSVEIPVGYSIDIIQTGTGSVTVSEGSGAVSINSKSNIKSLDGQYSKGTLVKIADNTWFFFGNLLNVVTPVTPTAPTPVAPTPVAPTPVAPTPVAPTPVEPTPTPPAPTPPSPTPPSPTPPAPTPPAPTPTPPQLPTPSLSVTSQGWNTYPTAAYANITVGNYSYDNTYTSTIGTQNPEFPEEWNLGNLNPNQSYTVYITASRAGYTSAQGSVTFSGNPASTPTPVAPTPVAPTPVAPTPTGPTTYDIYTYCDPLFPSMRGGAYGTQTAGTTVITGTTTTQGLTSEQIVAQLGYAGGCPTVPIVNPGTVYISYCNQGAPVVETYPINADNVLTTNINEACSVYTTLLTNIGATSIDCSTSSARTAPTGCASAPTPVAPTPTAPTPTASYPTLLPGLRYCTSGDVPNPASPCTQSDVTNGNCKDGTASGSLCPVAPTPVAPTPTSTIYYAYGCCNGDPVVVDGPNNNTARAEYQGATGCTAAGASTNYDTALANAQAACDAQTPTPVAPTPTAPTPVAPTPVASCPPNDGGSYQATNVFSNTCQDLGLDFVCRSGNIEYCRSAAPAPVAPTPVAPTPTAPNCQQCDGYSPYADGSYGTRANDNCYSGSEYYRVCITPSGCLNRTDTFGCVPSTPVAPTPVAPTPTGGSATCPGQSTNPALYTCAELGLTRLGGSDYYSVPAGWSCCSAAAPTAPTPVAPTPTAPLDCSPCDPQYSGGACGQYGNGTLCYTPSGCPNRCDGDHPPVPAPVAPVAPTAPSRRTCSPSDYANQCCSCYSVGACDANGSQSLC